MKVYAAKINNTDQEVRAQLAVIFNYLIKQQLLASKMSDNVIASGRILQGEVTIYAESTYDSIRAELFINNAISTVNLFSTDNGDFESYTDKEKEKLHILLKSTKREVKDFYAALKNLMKLGVYPPYSMQDDLMTQASTFKLENEQEEQELNSLIAENIKGSDLQTASWAWKNITESRNDKPLRKSLTILAVALKEKGIENEEEMIVNTKTFSRKVYSIGTKELKRIALQSEVDNAANITNMIVDYVPIYTPVEAYLTAVLHSLYAPSSFYLEHIYYNCTSTDSSVPYALRFGNVAALYQLTHNNISNAVLAEKYKAFVLNNIPTFEKLITELLPLLPTLVKKWKNSNITITYPEDYNGLQAYYEYQNVDMDTLDSLLAIDSVQDNVVEQLKRVKEAGVRGDYDKVPYDIACKGLNNIKRKGAHGLSAKQLAVITKKIQSLDKTAAMSKEINAEECIEVANAIKNNHKARMNNVVSNIVESTLRYGICSQKQLDVMKLALVQYQQQVEQGQQKASQLDNKLTDMMFNVPGMSMEPTVQVQESTTSAVEEPVVTKKDAQTILEKQAESAYKGAYDDDGDEDDDDFI